MMRLLAIARNAFVEMTRQPIYGALIFVAIAGLVADVPLSSWTMGAESAAYKKTDQQLLVNVGMSTLMISGLFIAAFGAAGVVSREIRDRTILTVVSKPVSRATVVMGKFIGVAAAVTLAYWICSMVFLITVRHGVLPTVSDPIDWPVIVLGCSALAAAMLAAAFCNYFFGWHYISSVVGFGAVLLTAAAGVIGFVGKHWQIVPFGQEIPFNLPHAMIVMLFSNLIFAAVAVPASTRPGRAMTLVVCAAAFLAGVLGPYYFAIAGESAGIDAARRLVPDLKFFYVLDALVQAKPISAGYVALAAVYGACLIAAILAVGVALFQTRELEETASGAPLLISLLAIVGRFKAIVGAIVGVYFLAVTGVNVYRHVPAAAIGIPIGGGILMGAVFAWLFWGWFGRGVKWTYFLVMSATILTGGISVACLLGGGWGLDLSTPILVADVIVSGLCVLILLLPNSRYHFNLVRTPAPAAAGR